MDNSSSATPPKDAHDVPDWANWPLKPDGKLDAQRMMPTTFLVCSKEYSKSRQDLAKSLPSLAPKRDRFETKSVPFISNLTLLELYDLAGEEIIEFRNYILETLEETDRVNNTERLMNDHESIRRSMSELRKVANEIHEKKSREDSAIFLNKQANLAILGYFTRQDPRNQPVDPPMRPVKKYFKEFICGNKGAARVSVYNWRQRLWGASVSRNLSLTPPVRVAATRRTMSAVRRVIATKPQPKDYSFDTVDGNVDSPGTSHRVSQWKTRETSVSPSDAKKMEMKDGFNIKNAIGKGREEVNFYCAVKANKVNPEEFGLPTGFVKYGDQIVHHSKKERVDKSERKRRGTIRKKKVDTKRKDKKEAKTSEGSVDRSSVKDNEEGDLKINEWKGSEVILDDIDDDDEDEMESDEEIDVVTERSIVITSESSTQTHLSGDVMMTENGGTIINAEVAKQLEKLEAVHAEDVGIIQKLKMENGLAFKNLSKYHNKYVALMMDRNNIRCTFNLVDKERKSDKMANNQLSKTVKHLTHQNALLLDEVNALKREIAIRDQLDFANKEVGRYEEFSG